MHLQHLVLRNFRSFKEVDVTFCPRLNFFQGNNAQGKTNLLEAIVFLSTGRSFRTKMLRELIYHDAPYFYIEAHFKKGDVSHDVKAHFDGKERKLQIDGTSYTSFNPLLGVLPTVLYAPDHLSLVTGPPAERRQFLDLHLSQLDPQYLYHLTRYTGAMKQRNALLKQETEMGIESWEEIMAHASEYILAKRKEAILLLLPSMREALSSLSQGSDHFNMAYQATFDKKSSYLDQLATKRPQELGFGSSLIGPHRDDFLMELQGKSARHFASEGQKRCLLTALRFGQWQRVAGAIADSPLLAIDDFGAHLDEQRRLLLQEQMKQRGQVFLTAPQFDSTAFTEAERQTFLVKDGKVTTRGYAHENVCF